MDDTKIDYDNYNSMPSKYVSTIYYKVIDNQFSILTFQTDNNIMIPNVNEKNQTLLK